MPKEDSVSRDSLALGERLYRARQAASTPAEPMTAERAGQAIGKSGMSLGRWEKGQLEPTLHDLIGLAKLYGVDPGELAFGDAENRARLVAEFTPASAKAVEPLVKLVAEAKIPPAESARPRSPSGSGNARKRRQK